jgi:hypothetical protein
MKARLATLAALAVSALVLAGVASADVMRPSDAFRPGDAYRPGDTYRPAGSTWSSIGLKHGLAHRIHDAYATKSW